MNFIRRWTTSISSSFEWVLNQVENHDAIVTATIRDMQAAGMKAKMQLVRVQKDGDRMRKRVKELSELEVVWAERAVRANKETKEKAIECLRRRKNAERERVHLEEQIVAHAKLEKQLVIDLKLIEERIAELKRKKNAFNARQYRAEALKASQLSELGLVGEIDEIFDRWDSKIGEYDNLDFSTDVLEEEFLSEEERTGLENELQDLLQSRNNEAAAEQQ